MLLIICIFFVQVVYSCIPDKKFLSYILLELSSGYCMFYVKYIYHDNPFANFDVLLTVHLSIFISVINQLDAQNFVLQ